MTTNTESPTYIATPCPPWCELPTMHPVDGLGGEGGDFRIHSGPRFGPFLYGYAEEYVKAPGELRVGVDLEASDIEIATPAELRRLAADATAAAEWLESQQ